MDEEEDLPRRARPLKDFEMVSYIRERATYLEVKSGD